MNKTKQTEFVTTVMAREWCDKHSVPQGVPCFYIHSGVVPGLVTFAICNQRATRAGFNGKITDASLRPKRREMNVRRRS